MKNERLDLVLIPGWYGYHAGCVPKLHRLRIKQKKKIQNKKLKPKKHSPIFPIQQITHTIFCNNTNGLH